MLDPRMFDEFMDRVMGLLPPGAAQLRDDFQKNLNATLQSLFSRMDLVTREEFDVQAAVLLRTRQRGEAPVTFAFGDIQVDFEQHIVTRNEEPLTLALKEFEILHLLVRHRGEIVSRERMLEEVWGYDPGNFPETRTVDNHIAKLRNKVGAAYIETVPKLGYRFTG